MTNRLACLLVIAASGCPDIPLDTNETATGPMVEFDPARSLVTKARFVPFPNDLVRDPMTGKVNLPDQACESAASKATRVNILNKLDGFGTYEVAMQVSLTDEVDEATLQGNVVMYQRTDGTTDINPAGAMPVPILAFKGTTIRLLDGECTSPEMVNTITIVPRVPLKQKSAYVVAVLKGLKSTAGKDFGSSYTWGLVAAKEDPVTLDDSGNVLSDRTPLDPSDPEQLVQLKSLDGLWKLHAKALGFLDAVPGARPRSDVLVAFQMTTQTTTDPLDPGAPFSVASALSATGFAAGPGTQVNTVGSGGTALCGSQGETNATQCFLKLALGGCSPQTTGCGLANYQAGNTACASAGCTNIADVMGGAFGQAIFQAPQPNPLMGGATIPGPWSDPVKPDPQATDGLKTLIFIPTGTMPTNGWPTVIFGHGLGSSKEALFAIAGGLAKLGFASVAIDFQSHGSRAVRTSKDPLLACMGQCATSGTPNGTLCETIADCPNVGDTCGIAGTPAMFAPPSPTTAPQCYAPFLSSDLATTRDGIRQTVLDLERLVNVLKACGSAGCNGFGVDASKLLYLGQSLGSIIGTTFTGMQPDVKTAVLNVGAVGWIDVLENTRNLAIRCSLVDGLIDAGILMGDKWNKSSTAPTGLCATDAWKMQPGYLTFSAIGRWVIDPADPANFAAKTALKRLLIQEVVDDEVVPNVATERQAAVMGLMTPMAADVLTQPGIDPASAAITGNPAKNLWLQYTTSAQNVYAHASLLRPANATTGALATARLQTDAIYFLFVNK